MISVLQLGRVDYPTGLQLQQRLVEMRKNGQVGDVLLLLEHEPVITLGRNAKIANVIASPELLRQRGVELYECDRGGDVTFHGPGQIVGYPIFDLRGFPASDGKRKTIGAVEFVRRLEEVLIRTCADFGIPVHRIAGLTGVWTKGEGHDSSRAELSSAEATALAAALTESKIVAIGVHISRGVTSHGFALNVNPDLSHFDLIVPCGIPSKQVTSMHKELGSAPDWQKVAHSLSRNVGIVFESQVLWLESLDSLLGPTLGVPMRPPAELRQIRGDEDITWA
jgi:lipoyl(octanoyl) transferase